MKYRIEYEKAAVKFIKKQNSKIQEKLMREIDKLPEGNDIKKLKGFVNHYRLRIGDIRVIYIKIDDLYIVKVINIDNRGGVHK